MNKKILIFSTNYFPHVGGAEMAIREICKRLPENEYHLVTTKFEKNISNYEQIENIHVYRVGFGHKIDKYLFFILSQFKAHSLNIKYNFDISWGMMASYAGLSAWIFKKIHSKVKYFLTLSCNFNLSTLIFNLSFNGPVPQIKNLVVAIYLPKNLSRSRLYTSYF